MNSFILAVEGGGTRTRVVLADVLGKVQASVQGGSSSPLYIAPAAFRAELEQLIHGVCREAGAQVHAIALAALAGPLERPLVRAVLDAAAPGVRVIETGEADMALMLHGLEWGATVTAGTGASARFKDRDGRTRFAGGMGPQFDDAGSAYWIARGAVAAAVRSADGRGPDTELLARALAHFGAASVWELIPLAVAAGRVGHIAPPCVAALAPRVFEAARNGDAVANDLCAAAGRELARLVTAVARGREHAAPPGEPVPLALTGGVFHGGGLITGPLREELLASGIEFEVYPEVTDPIGGLLKIAAHAMTGDQSRVS